jgi:hypothetical protein
MTTRGEIEGITDARQLEAMRRAACVALGIEFAAVAWPSENESEKSEQTQDVAAAGDSKRVQLSDADWDLIAPLLPSEAPQTKSMPNRDFLEAVLTVMRRGGTWASRYTPAADIEAVRRRFGEALSQSRRWTRR